jgi:predicted enzyme related to lactoylglutathione lyase
MVPLSGPTPASDKVLHGRFTGELLFPIYVSDVMRSAAFYRDVLGFDFLGFYDYDQAGYVTYWRGEAPPLYAGFLAGTQSFGLHKPLTEQQEESVGRGRFYFRVQDVEAHHRRVRAWGGRPGSIQQTAFMRLFEVTDPDGLTLYFATTPDDAPVDPW